MTSFYDGTMLKNIIFVSNIVQKKSKTASHENYQLVLENNSTIWNFQLFLYYSLFLSTFQHFYSTFSFSFILFSFPPFPVFFELFVNLQLSCQWQLQLIHWSKEVPKLLHIENYQWHLQQAKRHLEKFLDFRSCKSATHKLRN